MDQSDKSYLEFFLEKPKSEYSRESSSSLSNSKANKYLKMDLDPDDIFKDDEDDPDNDLVGFFCSSVPNKLFNLTTSKCISIFCMGLWVSVWILNSCLGKSIDQRVCGLSCGCFAQNVQHHFSRGKFLLAAFTWILQCTLFVYLENV